MTRMRIRRAVALLALTAVLVPAGSAGASRGERDPRIDELRDQVGEMTAAEAEALGQLFEIQGKRKELDAQVAVLDAQLGDAQSVLDAAEAAVERLGAEIQTLTARIQENDRAIDDSRAEFVTTIGRLYRGGGSATSGLSAFFDASSPREAASASRYLEDVSREDQREMQRYTVLKIENGELRDERRAQEGAAKAARDVAETERNKVATIRDERDAVRDQVVTQEQAEQSQLAAIRSKKAEYEAEIKKLEEESRRIEEQLRRSSDPGPAPKGNGQFVKPVNGPIVSGFGSRVHPVYGTVRMHQGIDISAGSGTPIRAAGDGVVVSAGWNGGYGNCTIIDHGNGLATLYGHQSSLGVSAGQTVKTNEVIGYVGSTGLSTGPHLHWEVRANGTPVNPMAYL